MKENEAYGQVPPHSVTIATQVNEAYSQVSHSVSIKIQENEAYGTLDTAQKHHEDCYSYAIVS